MKIFNNNSIYFLKFPILSLIHRLHNVNVTKLTGDSTEKDNNIDKKKITQLLNCNATNIDAVTEDTRTVMIIHIYLDESYTSEPEARSIADGYFS